MQFITTVLTCLFQAGVKELGVHYVTMCMSFHKIYQALNPKHIRLSPAASPNNYNNNNKIPAKVSVWWIGCFLPCSTLFSLSCILLSSGFSI